VSDHMHDAGPQERADRLAALLDSVTEAVFTLDDQWRFTYANRAALRGLRRSESDLLGRSAMEVYSGFLGSAFHTAYQRARDTGEPVEVEDWAPGLNGWFRATAYPGPDGLTVFFRDTTDERRRELADLVLDRLTVALAEAAGPIDSLQIVARELYRLTGAALVELWSAPETTGPMELVTAEHDGADELRALVAAAATTPYRPESAGHRALQSGEPLLLTDLTDPERFRRAGLVEAAGVSSGLLLPVMIDGVPAAALGLLFRQPLSHTDWPAVLMRAHRDVVALIGRQRERHDLVRFWNLSRDLLVVAGADGHFKRLNPRWTEVLGWTEDELRSRPWRAFVHPDDLDVSDQVEQTVLNGQPVYMFNNRYVAKEGQVRVLSWNSFPIETEGLIYAAARDVTEDVLNRAFEDGQREVLRSVVLGEDLGRTLEAAAATVESALPGAWVSVHLYEPLEHVLRLAAAGPSTPAELREEVAKLSIGPTQGSSGAAAHLREAVVVEDTAIDERFDDRRQAAQLYGVRSSWSTPVLGADGELIGTLAVYRPAPGRPDDRERRVLTGIAQLAGIAVVRDRATAELSDNEERFRLLAQATSDAIWDWDLATDGIRWSDGFERLFGWPLDTLEPDSMSWVTRIHPDDRDAAVASVYAAMEGDERIWSETYRFMRADGSVAWVQDRGTILRDRRGQAIRMIGGMVDDTERRRLEEQYLRAQRLESIGTLAGGIAHDLNNVLAPIVMGADLLLFGNLDEEDAETVRTIADSARRGADMVRQVLTFARGVGSEQMPVSPADLLADIERMAADTFPKHIEVVVTADDDVWTVQGDPVQLQQVILNLAVNARDAMEGGGRLELSATNVTIDESYAAMRTDVSPGTYVCVTAIDTGSGMSADVQTQMFEPFFTTKSDSGGTGLGLPTAQAIVAAHRGFIDVDSEPGRGTTVRVHLPASPDQVPASTDARAPSLPRGHGQLVLVVDDEAAVRAITQQTLEAFGYRVITANDGAEAVAMFARMRDDVALVVTDVMMPVMDGTAMITAVRRLSPDVPVIAVSGLARSVRSHSDLAGVARFLPKPFTSETLLNAVHEVLQDSAHGAS
jgi:PAS domain S-box-containing protein